MGDLLIRGGFLVDGTGAPGRRADVRITRGRISEIGEALPIGGCRTIDADGSIRAPGFIDNHTHFDATVFWDARFDPMCEHGVTTVAIGNCGLGLAPLGEQTRAA